MRRTGKILLAAVLMIGAVAGFGGPAQAATPPPGSAWSELFNPLLPLVDGRYHVCLDVPEGSTEPGRLLHVFHCHAYDSGGAPQRWEFLHFADNTYWIVNNRNMCVTAQLPAINGVYRVSQKPCNTADGQAWRLVDVLPGGNFQIRSASPTFINHCLEATANRNSATVVANTCAVQAFQIWAFG